MGLADHQRHEARCLKLFLDGVLHPRQLEHRWSDLNRFNCVSNALRGQAVVFGGFKTTGTCTVES